MSEKHYYMPFNVGDWLKDPAVSSCTAATRGVWFDLLCAMHESGRTGQLSKSAEIMCRLGRCTAAELDHALTELQTTGAADVTKRNGNVTVVNRRMRREFEDREGARLRKKRSRENAARHGDVTPTPETETETKITLDQREGRAAVARSARSSRRSGLKKFGALDLSLEVLRDPRLFDDWCRDEMQHPKGLIKTADDREFALAAREKALNDPEVRNPVGWMKDALRFKAREWVPASAAEAVNKPKGPIDADVAKLIQIVAERRKAMA